MPLCPAGTHQVYPAARSEHVVAGLLSFSSVPTWRHVMRLRFLVNGCIMHRQALRLRWELPCSWLRTAQSDRKKLWVGNGTVLLVRGGVVSVVVCSLLGAELLVSWFVCCLLGVELLVSGFVYCLLGGGVVSVVFCLTTWLSYWLAHRLTVSLTDWLVITVLLTDYITVLSSYWLSVLLTDYISVLLTDLLSYWLTDWLTYYLTVLLNDCLTDWLYYCLTDWLVLSFWLYYCFTDRLTVLLTILLSYSLLTVLLTDWLSLTDSLADLLPYWLSVLLTYYLTDCLTDSLTDWLSYWLLPTDCGADGFCCSLSLLVWSSSQHSRSSHAHCSTLLVPAQSQLHPLHVLTPYSFKLPCIVAPPHVSLMPVPANESFPQAFLLQFCMNSRMSHAYYIPNPFYHFIGIS